jgi:RNA polymerase sigma factor (sigma-70 family)
MEFSNVTVSASGPVQACRAPGRRRSEVSKETHGELLRQAVNGHQDAWAELVRRFNPMIVSIARRTGLSGADAADVGQETWLRLARNAHSIREPEQVAGWLARTARRESVRVAISSNRQIPVAEPIAGDVPSDASAGGAADGVLAYQVGPEMAVALSKLPQSSRRLLGLLVSDADLSYDEIASHLGIPVGSIGPTRNRALHVLRRQMKASRSDLLPAA